MSETLEPQLLAASYEEQERRCIRCEDAHAIAEAQALPLTDVGAACQALKLKITDCSLGCFGVYKQTDQSSP